jgi:hypothetical protein
MDRAITEERLRGADFVFIQSFTAEDAKDAKEQKSLTAKDAKDAKDKYILKARAQNQLQRRMRRHSTGF